MEEWALLGFYLGLGFGVGYGLVGFVARSLWWTLLRLLGRDVA